LLLERLRELELLLREDERVVLRFWAMGIGWEMSGFRCRVSGSEYRPDYSTNGLLSHLWEFPFGARKICC
jgi:hypothetical protein